MSIYRKLIDRAVAEYRTGSGVTLWRAQIATGNGGTFRKQGFTSKAEAAEWAKLMFEKRALRRGQIVRASSVSFASYAEQWLQDKRDQGVRPQTLMRYEDELRLRVLPYFGRTKLDTLTKSHLVGFLRQLRSTGLSSTSTNFAGQLFKSIVKQAELEDAMPPTGIHNVPLPKKERPTPIFWTGSEIERFLALTANHPSHDLWTFALFTGMRAGEIAGLKQDCIHIDRVSGGHKGFIEVRRSIEQKTQKLVETTKNGDRRIIPILPPVREILLKHTDGEFVFGGATPLDTSHFARDIAREARKLGLPKITFHGLRHSFCSWIEAQGMNRSITSKIMGHRSQLTTDRYSHANEDSLGQAVGDFLVNQRKSNNLSLVR
jgi:integrase